MATRTATVERADHPRSRLLARRVGEMLELTERTAAGLERLGIVTLRDLIRHFPYRYDDLRNPVPIAELARARDASRRGDVAGEVNALGTVLHCSHIRIRGRIRAKTTATIDDGTGTLTAVWFGRPYLANQLRAGSRVFVRGRVDFTLTGMTMNVSRHRVLRGDEPYAGELVPVYPQTAGLGSHEIRRFIQNALRMLAADRTARAGLDPIPLSINKAERFGDAWHALTMIHAPDDQASADEARRRLVFEEFFVLAMGAARRRAQRLHEPGPDFSSVTSDAAQREFEDRVRRATGFQLTRAQRRVIDEVAVDMRKRTPMNRLLQGDVGSGKTAVAMAAMLLAAQAGYQSAFMAPTEVLAAQQFNKISASLSHLSLRCALLVGALKRRTREDILDQLRAGDLDVVVGTHALLTEDVDFKKLGLAIIDEQHRFGVLQRAALRAKSKDVVPHTLVMTATPIPRTLAQTVYADLDVSIIDELPPGRRPVKTYVRGIDAKAKVLAFVRAEVEKGHQAFVVCPAIDESERALHSAQEQAEVLRASAFAKLQVGLLHGRMSSLQKDEVMRLFADGFTKVLISTTVVEVGVDMPNATVMLVLDAHAFGLAQLHQLRGRVGRSSAQSYCILVAPDPQEAARLAVMAKTNDGFEIAEEDMKLRGSGDLAGTRQHGGNDLRLAHLVRDFPVFVRAKKAAERLVERDPNLTDPAHRALAAFLAEQDTEAALRQSS
ncbi:MAG TPA: ATP-dependent DNA helicase RecG [Candidatus Acidoferrales bacterium]|nr:ATP-dependent DNA helicase RecG [Candidatus Acidoferrales bacterium]